MKLHQTTVKRKLIFLILPFIALVAPIHAEDSSDLDVGVLQLRLKDGIDGSKLEEVVEQTRKRSLEMREKGLAEMLAMNPAKIKMPWLADWITAALYKDEKRAEANAIIRNLIKESVVESGENDEETSVPGPEKSKAEIMRELNLGGAGINLLVMFGKHGKYPGRLEADVETNLKKSAWNTMNEYLSPESAWQARMSEFGGKKYEIFPLEWGRMWGTENHDVRRKPWVYFALSALIKDPEYASKSLGGHTVEQWFDLMNNFMKRYMKERVLTGLWIEPGSHYANITYNAMINLYEMAPDPVVRQQAKMFLDLALIEDEQISVNGYRGGARSRTPPLLATTSNFKDMVFGDKSGLLLTDYQAPAVAIALRNADGAVKPYEILNRVPGENSDKIDGYAHVSRLISYAYRTAGYVIGSALQDPNLDYHATSDQRRWSGVIFQSGEAVYPWPKEIFKTKDSGRSSKAFWGVQHEGALVVQKLLKSDSVDRIDVVFTHELKISERDGWIFAEAGSGYVAVRFIDPSSPTGAGTYTFSEAPKTKRKPFGKIASPENDFLPIIIEAGDASQFVSFEEFQNKVLANKLEIRSKDSELDYKSLNGATITWNYNQNAQPIVLPRVNGKTPDLAPPLLFNSPFFKAKWDDSRLYTGAGPFRAVYDFEKNTVEESKVE
jgi:hypothetical protein